VFLAGFFAEELMAGKRRVFGALWGHCSEQACLCKALAKTTMFILTKDLSTIQL
jgi:hypothetical protein